jgi:hypothetical protein
MTNTQRPELSSIFDDMLAQNKKRFDDLYRGGRPYAGGFAAGPRAFAGSPATVVPSPSAVASTQLDPASAAARRLNERFGNDWRYEIAEKRRDGDEAIVLCKLILGKAGAVRTQFGSAKLSDGPVAGASDGVRFKLGHASAELDERDAFRRATEVALMNCIDLI